MRPVLIINQCSLVAAPLDGIVSVQAIDCDSQVGSGALPAKRIASAGLAIRPISVGRRSGAALKRLTSAFRNPPVPVIGRMEDNALVLDLRCLEDADETEFVAQLANLVLSASPVK